MPSPSKNKGSNFEREIAKFLTEQYHTQFIRCPGSGAYTGGSNSSRKQFLHDGQIRSFKGDIVPGEHFDKLNIECKSYKEFPWHQLLSNECKLLDTWIDQIYQAADDNDFNVLFMKFNRIGKFIAVESKHDFKFNSYFLYQSKKYNNWVIADLNEFFELNSDQFKSCSVKDS